MADWKRVTRTRAGVVITSIIVAGGAIIVADKGFDNPDTGNPVVRVDAIASPVDGTVALAATCKDNVGCTGVTFELDGVPIAAQDTSAPYTLDWDTTGATDATHALTATAVDAAGNSATSTARNVDVSNGLANEWVAVTAGSSPSRCSSPCAFNADHAYGSFNDAASAASADDLILVRDGTYPAQAVTDSPSGTGAITIKSVNGQAHVTTGSITVSTSYVTVDGFSTADDDPTHDPGYGLTQISAYDDSGANPRTETHITFQNISTHAAYINSDDVTFNHVVVGPAHMCNILFAGGTEDGILVNVSNVVGGSVHDLTLDDVTVHDIDRWQDGVESHGVCNGPSGVPHTDGIQFFSGDGVTITNSHFYRNATSNILARPCCAVDPVLDDWTVTNSEFSETLEGGNLFLLGADAEDCGGSNNFLFENNTFAGALRLGCTGNPATVRGNIFVGFYQCGGPERNGTYSYNVYGADSDSSCTGSPHATLCIPTWAQSSHPDGNWDTSSSDTCARDAADPTVGHFPQLDIHGDLRPIGPAPDAGANEAG